MLRYECENGSKPRWTNWQQHFQTTERDAKYRPKSWHHETATGKEPSQRRNLLWNELDTIDRDMNQIYLPFIKCQQIKHPITEYLNP